MYGYFLQPHNFFVPSPNEAVHICADFKGLPNGANFILIDHCVGELLSINKVSSESEHTITSVLIIRCPDFPVSLYDKAPFESVWIMQVSYGIAGKLGR